MDEQLHEFMKLSRWWARLTEQGTFWFDAKGEPHRIDDMSEGYRRNVVRFLERRAPRISLYAGFGAVLAIDEQDAMMPPGDIAGYLRDEALDEEWQQQLDDPVGWLHSTPLYKALAEPS